MRWMVKRAGLELLGVLARVFGRLPVVRLGFGSDDEGRSYTRQFVTNARTDWWGSADRKHDYLAGLAGLTLPILSVVGTADEWICHPNSARRWLSRAPQARVSYRTVGELPGDPDDIDHMGLVLKPSMAPIWREVGGWLVETLSVNEG